MDEKNRNLRLIFLLLCMIAGLVGIAWVSQLKSTDTLALVLRIIVISACTISLVTMIIGFIRYRKFWNEKTRDYWFGRVMWCIAGAGSGIEAIVRHTSIRYSIVFFIVASMVTLKGVMTRGSWGTPPEAVKKIDPTQEKRLG